MTDDSAIVHYWDNETDTPIYGRFAYSIVDDKAVIGEPVRVYARYLTEDEIAALENPPAPQPEFNDKGQGDGSNGEPQTKDTDPAPAAPEQMGEPAPSFSSTTLTDAERAELENFRKQAKLNLIASYKNDLPQDILDEFSSKVDELDKKSLRRNWQSNIVSTNWLTRNKLLWQSPWVFSKFMELMSRRFMTKTTPLR